MPERAIYDEAILLSQVRLKVQNSELKGGNVEKFTVQTVAGPMERAWGVEGGFAVVYKFRTRNGDLRALRCFRVYVDPDIQMRYERIGPYFATHIPTITAKFWYHDQGITVKEVVQGQRQNVVYPLIEMEWIEGLTLIDHVDELCRKQDHAGLGNLAKQWIEILMLLRSANISHGDLAGLNVMVRNTGQLVLVDYDGVYIPEFAAAGLKPVVLGQNDYQHPQMQDRPFNERTDDFSGLVIYTALLALHLRPELWEKHTTHDKNGKLMNTNLLFLQQDFVDPERSVLMRDLEQINDVQFKKALRSLKYFCQIPVQQVQLLTDLIDPDQDKKQALEQVKQAIQSDDDEHIITVWTPTLAGYAPAQQYTSRVELANKRLEALKHFRAALQTKDIQQIVAAYDSSLLDKYKLIKAEEQAHLRLARLLGKAFQDDNDQEILALLDTIDSFSTQNLFIFNRQEQQTIDVALKRKAALIKFRLALVNKHPQQIVAAYESAVLDASNSVTHTERELLHIAQNFVRAYNSDDDRAIINAVDEIENFSYRQNFIFTPQEQQRTELARERQVALLKFRLGLMKKHLHEIATTYDSILDTHKDITPREYELVRLAKNFILANYKNDDLAIITIADEIQYSYQQNVIFTGAEQQRIALARERSTARQKFDKALASKDVLQIAAWHDPALLSQMQSITTEIHEAISIAHEFMQAYQNDDDQELVNLYEQIQHISSLQKFFLLTEQQQQRVALAQQRKSALVKFHIAAQTKQAKHIVTAYEPILDSSKNMTQAEHGLIKLARKFVEAYERNDDKALLIAWDEMQQIAYRASFSLTTEEQQRITLAKQRKVASIQTDKTKPGGQTHA